MDRAISLNHAAQVRPRRPEIDSRRESTWDQAPAMHKRSERLLPA
jgi:hypothetical protein